MHTVRYYYIMGYVEQVIEQIYVEESGKVLAALIGRLGDFELAEDVLQEAFVTAMERWSKDGLPANPAGWLTVTARNRAIDRLRRARTLEAKQQLIKIELESQSQAEPALEEIPDERLKLIFTCCHPSLSTDAQIALTLKTLGGLTTEEIARAFLVQVKTMQQRLVRAKRRLKDAEIPYQVPPIHLLEERLQAVLAVIYLVFNEGYAASQGEVLVRRDLCAEAIRLARVLNRLLRKEPGLQESPEALGLLALMLLHDSRRETRTSPDGELVLLEEQDRTMWDREKIDEGTAVLDRALAFGAAGPYQLQAAISALHAHAETYAATDWPQIAALYQRLNQMTPSPVIRLNQIVAVAMAEGPARGLALLEEMGEELDSYVPFHAAKADMFRRLAQSQQAAAAYEKALALSENEIERRFFRRRLKEIVQT